MNTLEQKALRTHTRLSVETGAGCLRIGEM